MKYYFVTGASRGLGKAIALEALKRNDSAVTGISRTHTIAHLRYASVTLDLGDRAALMNAGALFPELPDAERIVLVNNAGALGPTRAIGAMQADEIEAAFTVNIAAPLILMNGFLARYAAQQCPKVVINVTSGAGQHAVDGWSVYCASKAALDMISLVAAREAEMSGANVRVFAVAPGVVDTAMQAEIRALPPDSFSRWREFRDYHARGMLAAPQAVAPRFIALAEHAERYDKTIMSVEEI